MITVEKCCCDHPNCEYYWLVGIGKFVQGSGFTKKEAEQIAFLLNLDNDVGYNILDLYELLETQRTLQHYMGQPTGTDEAGLKENLLHVMVETCEALAETNFKPWKTTKKEVDRKALATELTDILQFWANAAIAMQFTPEELTEALRTKWKVNHDRIENGDVTKGAENVKDL
jgi:hypothetical protein